MSGGQVLTCGRTTIRLAPPLVIRADQVDVAVATNHRCLRRGRQGELAIHWIVVGVVAGRLGACVRGAEVRRFAVVGNVAADRGPLERDIVRSEIGNPTAGCVRAATYGLVSSDFDSVEQELAPIWMPPAVAKNPPLAMFARTVSLRRTSVPLLLMPPPLAVEPDNELPTMSVRSSSAVPPLTTPPPKVARPDATLSAMRHRRVESEPMLSTPPPKPEKPVAVLFLITVSSRSTPVTSSAPARAAEIPKPPV